MKAWQAVHIQRCRRAAMITILLLMPIVWPTIAAAPLNTSTLWGMDGERWDPRGRLPDFSYAGYHGGEQSLPTVSRAATVKDFGAKGDGITDDTQAFVTALSITENGALLVPAGRYLITQVLKIQKGRLVLRGEGSHAQGSVLYFPNPLMTVHGLQELPNPNVFSWGEGFIEVTSSANDRVLTTVVEPAKRGDRVLKVASPVQLRPGMILVLQLRDNPSASLRRHVFHEQFDPRTVPGDCSGAGLEWPVRIDTVQGDLITLYQPLRLDVRLEWKPTLSHMATIEEVGIEHLRIEFPAMRYGGHHREPGNNAIHFRKNVVNSWVRDVTFHNVDSGVFVTGRSKWNTVTDVRFTATRPAGPDGKYGHHGLVASGSSDNLFTNFTFETDVYHPMTVSHQANGNVFSNGRGTVPLELDHHRYWVFENLFTNIDTPTTYGHAGDKCAGPFSAARSTLWNVKGPLGIPPSAPSLAPDIYVQPNVIGNLDPVVEERLSVDHEWYERVPNLFPKNLHDAQLHLRRKDLGLRPLSVGEANP